MSLLSSQFAVCRLAVVPVRRFADMVSEMTTQLRFGEGVEILQQAYGMWQIRVCHDDYEGWVDARQFTPHQSERPPQATVLSSELSGWAYRIDPDLQDMENGRVRCLLPQGTPLPKYADGCFWIGPDSWHWPGAVHCVPSTPSWEELLAEAMWYRNAPYFWGGRTIWGIDCSGLVQSLLQHQGVQMSRDCLTQVDEGAAVSCLRGAMPGDLAFFDGTRDGGRHVGFVLENGEVLHASGFVRVDILTDRGIVVKETGHLSHHLRSLRRVAAWQPLTNNK